MNDLSPPTLNADIYESGSQGNDPQNSSRIEQKKSQKSSNSRRKQKAFKKEPIGVAQSQHKHEEFSQNDQNDDELDARTKLGLIGSKKLKIERLEVEDKDLRDQAGNCGQIMEEESKQQKVFSIDGMLEKSKKSKGKSKILYQHHSARQEERNSIHQSLVAELSQQDKNINRIPLPAEDRKGVTGNLITFKYFEFDIQDYIILEILGEGSYGLVIKLRKRAGKNNLHGNNMGWNDVVVKLCRKGNPKNEEEKKKAEKDFINETIMLSMAQRAKQHSLRRGFEWEYRSRWNYFQNNYFKTEKFYGVFIKQGLGSLWDFKNYLKMTGIRLTGKELFFIAWSLLDSYRCLNKVNLCHRDIKPQNIVFDPETFLPEFIDFGLASDLFKVNGFGGTGGYQMEDFKMREYIERKREDHLVSNDYFALGKTILEIAFPTSEMSCLKAIKLRIKELKLLRAKEIIGEILEICLFGDVGSKKDILKKYEEKYFSEDDWNGKDEIRKQELKYIYKNFNPYDLSRSAEKLKEKHFDRFKEYMANKLAKGDNKANQRLPAIKKGLVSKEFEVKIKKNAQEDSFQLEKRSFYDEEQYIKSNFLKGSEKTSAMDKCYEIIHQIAQENCQTVNPQLYSTLMAVLYHNDSLDEAVALGKNALKLWGLEKLSGVFLTNLTFLERQRNLRDNPHSLWNEYEYAFLYLYDQYKDHWVEDLIRICTCATDCEIEKNDWTQERLEKAFKPEKTELLLADFEMNLEHQESYFLMSYCYIMASQIDRVIDNSTREKIKDFVYGANISEKEDMLSFLAMSQKESVLLTLMSFCEIFQDTTLVELSNLKDDAKHILLAKEALSENALLLYEPTHAMLGFIILYNLKYDLLTKFFFNEWIESADVKEIQAFHSNRAQRRLNRQYRSMRAEQDRKWSSQKFLDSTLFFLREIYGEIIQIPLVFEVENENQIPCLSIFGQQIENLLLPYPAVQGSHFLVLDFSQNLALISAVKIRFRLSEDEDELIKEFLSTFSGINKTLLQRLSLEFSDYDGSFSRQKFRKICNQLELSKLQELKIKMEDRMLITDQGIPPLLEFVATQKELNDLLIEFNQCEITSKTIKSLARNLEKNQNLEKIHLVFQNCFRIEEESILFLLDKMKLLPTLKYVELFFGACPGVESLNEPSDLPFRLIIRTQLIQKIPIPDPYIEFDEWFTMFLDADADEQEIFLQEFIEETPEEICFEPDKAFSIN